MDAYPPEYTDHNLPLIVLSGLGADHEQEELPPSHKLLQDGGFPINGHLPLVTGERADHLLNDFLQADGRDAPWNARSARGNNGVMGFRFKPIGREFKLPPKKAEPPPDEFSEGLLHNQSWVLHSPISPLSPISPTYPDGLMTPLWIAKHQYYAPAVFISFFSFTSDPNLNSLNDNQLKSEINSVNGMLQNSDYRTRYAVVLLSDKTILEAPDIEERLGVIRRATGLDPKTSLFFLPPNTSRVEISSFVNSVLLALQPSCVEYYRDLTKHSRRKKQRGTLPPPTAPPMTGRSQTLHSEGWAMRYEFKLGVLAEFRQEMDAACRHYVTAQDALLANDGFFRSTPNWSPRWDEARLLADIVALRIIRCLIWNNLPTHAVQSWLSYRERLRRILDECGKGATNYGWEAWQSRWAKVMAELIQKANVPIFSIPSSKQSRASPESQVSFYAPVEKAIPMGERINSWTMLHHPGYWLRISAAHAVSRRLLAENLPEEDRVSPALASASQLSSRSHRYDSYLCPEPHAEFPLPGNEGFNHSNDVVTKYNEAIREFSARGQKRAADKVALDIGKELIDAGRFDEALDILKPLWTGMSWRNEGWWPHVSEVSSYLHDCATQLKDAEVLLATEWELLHRDLGVRPGYSYDLMKCLDIFSDDDLDLSEKLSVKLQGDQVTSFLSVGCSLHGKNGHVGEPLKGQIWLTSKAHRGTSPVEMSNVTIQFEGNLDRIILRHEGSAEPSKDNAESRVSSVALKEEPGSTSSKLIFAGSGDLTIHPGQTKVFEFIAILREAGDLQATTSVATVSTERFNISCSSSLTTEPKSSTWFIQGSKDIRPTRLAKDDGTSIHIEPKPPKIQLRLPNLRDQYYTDELIALDIEMLNEEEEESDVSLEVTITGSSGTKLTYKWKSAHQETDGNQDDESSGVSARHPVGKLSPSAKHTETVEFSATSSISEFSVEIKALYHLVSDPDTPITQEMKANLIILSPFEANYDFQPRLHPDPWPSFFAVDEFDLEKPQSQDEKTNTVAHGLAQKWLLAARIASVAEETLIINDVEFVQHNVIGGAICSIHKDEPSGPQDAEVEARALDERTFLVDVQKISLEDRRSSALEVSLRITWRRPDTPESSGVASTINMPRLMIPSSEPRVLATCNPSAAVNGLLHFDYTIENPTLHFLTFDLTMEASDEFAFSGRKYGALQVLPMSRQHVSYKLLPLVSGQWIAPQLKVVDRYFNKTLRVLSADGTRQDKKDVLAWVDVPDEETK